jgi:hypothetical protein
MQVHQKHGRQKIQDSQTELETDIAHPVTPTQTDEHSHEIVCSCGFENPHLFEKQQVRLQQKHRTKNDVNVLAVELKLYVSVCFPLSFIQA